VTEEQLARTAGDLLVGVDDDPLEVRSVVSLSRNSV
jgi:hypothetical protein